MKYITHNFLVSLMVALFIASPAFGNDESSSEYNNKAPGESKESSQESSKENAENHSNEHYSNQQKSEILKLVNDLAKVVKANPAETQDTVKLRTKLAAAYANNQQFKEAAQQLEMVREYYKSTKNGTFDERLAALGSLVDNYNFLGDGERSLYLAEQYYNRVKDLKHSTHNDKLAGHWRLAYAYTLNGEYDKAQAEIDNGRKMVKHQYNSRCPMDGLLLQEQLKINLIKKEKKRASRTESDIMKSIDSTVTKNSNLGVFLMFQLAKIYSKYGDLDNAKRVLEKALDQPIIKKGNFASLKENLKKELEKDIEVVGVML